MLDVGYSRARRRARAGFTLMELLVVIGIISIFVGVIGFGFLRGSANSTVGLQTSQSIVIGLLTQARSQAILTGRDAAVLVNNNPNNPVRYRRYLCVVVRDSARIWRPLDSGVYLPNGVYVVPYGGLSAAEVDTGDWSAYESTALQFVVPALAIESAESASEPWIGVGFTPRGTTTDGAGGITGDFVLANGRQSEPGVLPPFVYTNREGVRGLAINAYGQARLLNEARDFLP